jgi:butyrate kinase
MFQLEKSIENQLREVSGPQPTLIFPESGDPRILSAASRLIQYAKIVLVRSRDEVIRDLEDDRVRLGVSYDRFLNSVCFANPKDEPELVEEFANEFVKKSSGRSWEVDLKKARELVMDPVYFSILAVRLGYADAVLGGVVHASRDFFKPCLRLLERDGTVYEMALFALPNSHRQGIFKKNLVMFADVALNPEPSSERLADIAVGACVTMRNLIPPEVMPDINGAILSYSTRGSGTGPSVDRIRRSEPLINEKLKQLAVKNPLCKSIHIATELQISCAISQEAALTKLGEEADKNPAMGNSNVLIVPSLDTGNLLYHIYITRYPDAKTVLLIGGMHNQALDFSRGSDDEDVVMGAKALILRMHRSERFERTPLDYFFPRYRMLTIIPRELSTEVGLWEGRELTSGKRIMHDEKELNGKISDQVPLRLKSVRAFVDECGLKPEDIEATVAGGGLVLPLKSGTYRVDEKMIDHLKNARSGENINNLGALLAWEVAGPDASNIIIIDPPIVDELDDVSRITGLRECEQETTWHALAQKAAAKMFAIQRGHEYEELNLIVAYLGTGISVGAHRKGSCVKVRNAMFDGPMTTVRAGSLPGMDLIELCYSGLTREEVVEKLTHEGGLMSYLGTADLEEVERRVSSGDEEATVVFHAFAEQIAAEIASMVPKFRGEDIDRVIIIGELAESTRLIAMLETGLRQMNIGISVYPGNREMEALHDGALRVLNGIEPICDYKPIRDKL